MDKTNGIWKSRILWMALSLLMSVLLWTYVTTTETSVIDKRFNDVQVVFRGQNTLNGRGLIVTGADLSTISVELRGNRRSLYNLLESEITAVVDVSQVVQSQEEPLAWSYTLSFPQRIDGEEIQVLWSSREAITFNVDKIASRQIDIRGHFNGALNENYMVEPMVISPSSVRITGSERSLKQISHGLVELTRENPESTVVAITDYRLVDENGLEIAGDDIAKSVEEVSVIVPILMMKEVELRLDWDYTAGATAANVSANFEPSKLKIAGDKEVLEQMNSVSLGRLNLASFASTHEESFRVTLRDDVRNVSGVESVRVNVEITGLSTERFSVTNFEFLNVPASYRASSVTESLEVTLRGQREVLDQIEPENIRAVVDLVSISGVGTTSLPAVIQVDGFQNVGAIFEPKLVIALSPRETENGNESAEAFRAN